MKRREIRKPVRYVDFAYCFTAFEEVEYSEQSSYKEAISSKNAMDWVSAMNEELQSLERNHTWTLVKPPSDKKIVGCKWVFKKKVDGSRPESLWYKAKLVAKGYSQVQCVDFNEVFFSCCQAYLDSSSALFSNNQGFGVRAIGCESCFLTL